MISHRSQKHHYIVKRREIELIRWQNQLAQLVQSSRSIENLEQCSYCLKNISRFQKEGNDLLNKWSAEIPVEEILRKKKFKSIEEKFPESKEISDRLNASLATCEKIRQDLLAKRAALLAAQQASPLEAPKIEASFQRTAHLESINVFNILPDLGAFSAGFDELEREYFHLKAEYDLT